MIDFNDGDLKLQYESFKLSPRYAKRKAQLRFAQIARGILINLVKKESVSNSDLTSLINMFGYGAKEETFRRHLSALRFSDELEKSIYEEYKKTGEMGITGIGLAAVKKLNERELDAVKALLSSVSEADSVEKVKLAVDAYDQKKVPKVTRGIYSPWLYYLKPGICPLLTGDAMKFFRERGLDEKLSYGEIVDLFGDIKTAVGEDNLGLIDIFIREVADKEIPAPNENMMHVLAQTKKQIILYGPPGTGKTYLTRKLSVELIGKGEKCQENALPDYPDFSFDNPHRSELAAKLKEFLETLEGLTKIPQKSMDGYYSISRRSQKNIGLAWIGRPSSYSSAIRVHVRKAVSGRYPSDFTSHLNHYKENGWGGYPEFIVENDRDLENAKNMIKYAYDHL